METKLKSNLKRGQKYRVTYRLEGLHRRDHEMVAVFLEEYAEKFTPEHANLYFDARPVAGTQTLELRYLIKAVEVPADTKVKVDP